MVYLIDLFGDVLHPHVSFSVMLELGAHSSDGLPVCYGCPFHVCIDTFCVPVGFLDRIVRNHDELLLVGGVRKAQVVDMTTDYIEACLHGLFFLLGRPHVTPDGDVVCV